MRYFGVLLLLGLPGSVGNADEPFVLVGLLHDDAAMKRPHDIELQGDLAYIPGKGGTLAIVDVADPAHPKLLSSLADIDALEDAETVLPLGKTLLVGARDFLAIDVSDPRHPKMMARIADRPRIDRINGMVRRGHYALTANKTGYIGVFDVRRPKRPRLVETLDTRAHGRLQSPHDIALLEDWVIVVNAAHQGPVYARVYRVADPVTHELLPVSRWKVEGAISDSGRLHENLAGANRVALAGRTAGIGAFVRDRIGIIDMTIPWQPVLRATMPVADIGANGMVAAGQVLFVAGGEAVEAIDVRNPDRPVSLAQYRNGRLFPTRRRMLGRVPRFDNAHDLVYRNGYLYVTAQNDNQFGILQIKDPTILELAGEGQRGN